MTIMVDTSAVEGIAWSNILGSYPLKSFQTFSGTNVPLFDCTTESNDPVKKRPVITAINNRNKPHHT